jgi:methylglyoxal synthase
MNCVVMGNACNIPVARNRATADFMISSPPMSGVHQQWDPHGRQESAPPHAGHRRPERLAIPS